MRGKEGGTMPVIGGTRITPAYAGKSNAKADYSHGDMGSPPPMRGKVSARPAAALPF